jgi:hypothetical protein
MLAAAGGCGEGATVRIENDWPTPLFPVIAPLIIDGIFVTGAAVDLPPEIVQATYNYLGPVETVLPTEHYSIYLIPGSYDIYVSAEDPDVLNCTRIYSLPNINLINTANITFTIDDTTEYYDFGDGCPVDAEQEG